MRLDQVQRGILPPILALTLLVGCFPSPQTTPSQPPVTPNTPTTTDVPTLELGDYCIGWDCALDGVVYAEEASVGNELEGAAILFRHGSYCSPTQGEYEAVTGPDGEFSFEVYLHDTDSFRFNVEVAGYEPAYVSFGGFECLYCSCPPIEIVLQQSGADPDTP